MNPVTPGFCAVANLRRPVSPHLPAGGARFVVPGPVPRTTAPAPFALVMLLVHPPSCDLRCHHDRAVLDEHACSTPIRIAFPNNPVGGARFVVPELVPRTITPAPFAFAASIVFRPILSS